MPPSPAAARCQVADSRRTAGSETWPTTVLRGTPRRVWMYPNSRSPCAAWLRFMKSKSMSAHGSSTFACVCRCSSGFCSASRPAIHIFAGLNVCIHAMTPITSSSAFASSAARRMASESVSTGFQTTFTGTSADSSSRRATCLRLLGDLRERLLAVQVLAAGEEPDLVAVEGGGAVAWGCLSVVRSLTCRRSEGCDGGGLDGEAGAVAVEVGGEAGDVRRVGVSTATDAGVANTRSSR